MAVPSPGFVFLRKHFCPSDAWVSANWGQEVKKEREAFPGFRQFSSEELEMPVVKHGMLPYPCSDMPLRSEISLSKTEGGRG